MAFTDQGKDVMQRFFEALEEVCTIESNPSLEGRTMTMILAPKKEKEVGGN